MQTAPKKRARIIKIALGLGLFALAGSFIPGFLTANNLLNVLRQSSVVGVSAVAVSMVIIIRGIDLSTGGVISLSGLLAGTLIIEGVPMPLALVITLVAGTVFGLVDGFVIARLHVPAFISTYVFGQIASSCALLLQNGLSIGGFPAAYVFIGNGKIFSIPFADITLVLFAVAGFLVLSKTAFGNHIYALGHNDTVAREEGININRIKIIVFGLSGLCAAVGGILLSAQMDAAHPTSGDQYQLDTVAACIIGGVSMLGGEGRVESSVLGAYVISLLRNACNLLGLHPYVQNLVVGTIMIFIVGVSILNRRMRERRALSF